MTKNRLFEMQAIQEEEGDGPMEEACVDFETGAKDTFLESLYEQVQKILNLLEKLQSDVDEVKRTHGEILSSPRSNTKIHQNLQDMMTEITKTALQIRAKLKVIKLEIDLTDSKKKNSAYDRIRRTQYSMLFRKYMDVMKEYNEEELSYKERCKNRIRRQLETTNRPFTEEEIEEMIERGDPAVYTQAFLQETERVRESLADIKARQTEILNLEKSILQLHALFKDMLILIERQGDMVDNIERHVEQAAEYVESGYQEIVKARKYQKNVRRKRCILIICLVVIIIILVIAIPVAIGSPIPD